MIDISFIIPNYNNEKYIEECLQSIINNNSVNNYEMIIIDDNSTDNSVKVINNFINNHKDITIKLHNNEINYGTGYCRELGIKKIKR